MKSPTSVAFVERKVGRISAATRDYWEYYVEDYFRRKKESIKVHKCSFCDYSSPILTNVKHHIMTHTGERPFSCPTCGQNFARKDYLVSHMKVHSDERPHRCHICINETSKDVRGTAKFYQCSECNFVSPWQSHVKRHLLIHTGERPFSCSICGQEFIQKAHLNSHMMRHDDNRPFKCHVCGKDFKRKDILKTHMIVHFQNSLS
ncbi:Gastrula zinc finger protein XlCGF57.1 like protein [Argiope bruennichi]|uniref:Gastrula zinc finger protein XlCGF57.1 like protein n=1 Tax=Argiope bruennichi TaxID=94029 RepID=A0A8T0E615_ARGBR|nr:Gastrula zinc finger protein XlCGF57.1 like protein [Argiope bruennichi]